MTSAPVDSALVHPYLRAWGQAWRPRAWVAAAPFLLAAAPAWALLPPVFALALWALGGLAVARAHYEELRGNALFTARATWRYAAGRAPRLLAVLLLFALFALAAHRLQELLAPLVDRALAPTAAGLLPTLVAWLGAPLLLLAALLALAGRWLALFALCWGPAIAAATDEPAVEVIAQILRHGLRPRVIFRVMALLALAALGLAAALLLWWAVLPWPPPRRLPPPSLLLLPALHAHLLLYGGATRLYLLTRLRSSGENLLDRRDTIDAPLRPDPARVMPHAGFPD